MASDIELHPDDLRDFFIAHLNKIYMAKSHLLASLRSLKAEAHFSDLKKGIQETTDAVDKQMARMQEIYALLELAPSEESCNGLLGLVKDSFEDIKRHRGEPVIRDLAMLFYLHNIESMEMASFKLLQMVAVKMKHEKIKRLVHQNYEDAKADRTLLLLITTKYIASA